MKITDEKISQMSDLFVERLRYRTVSDTDVLYVHNPFNFRTIGKTLKLSSSTVYKYYKEWIKKAAQLERPTY